MQRAFIALKLILLIFMAPAAWADKASPESFVEGVVVRLMQATEPERVPPASVPEYLAQLFDETIDMKAITRGVVGKHRKIATPEQVSQFQGEFSQSLVKLISAALSGVESYDIDVQEPRNVTAKRAQVPTVIATGKQGKVEIQFSLAATDGSWRVRNLVVNGVNLGLTYRNQFNELMKTHEGRVDNVIEAWASTINESS